MRHLAILLTVVLVLTLPAGAWGNGKSRGRTEIEGVIVSTALHNGYVVVRDEKGRTWVIFIDRSTDIEFEEDDDDDDDDHFPALRIDALRVGDEVEVKGISLGDGRLLALKIEVEGHRRSVRVPPPLPGLFLRGVVIVIASGTIVIVTDDAPVTVVIQPETHFFEGNRRIRLSGLARHDVVAVRGHRARGRFIAERVNLEFDRSDGVAFSGVVGSLWLQGGAFLIVGRSTWINVTSRTLIVHERRPAGFASIHQGGSVVVYGLGQGAAMQAMVIVVH